MLSCFSSLVRTANGKHLMRSPFVVWAGCLLATCTAVNPSDLAARHLVMQQPHQFEPHLPLRRRHMHGAEDCQAAAEAGRAADEIIPRVPSGLPYATVIARALVLIMIAIIVQTIKPHQAMPSTLTEVLRTWDGMRREFALSTTTCCALGMYMASDALTQCVTAAKQQREVVPIDVRRCMRSGVISSFLSGFVAVFYFGWLERTLSVPASAGLLAVIASACAKVAVDVGLYEPVYDTVYITLHAVLRGDGVTAAREEVRAKVLSVWRMAPRYWIAVDLVNFAFVSLRLKPLYNAFFSIPWSMYISSIANAGHEPTASNATARADNASM